MRQFFKYSGKVILIFIALASGFNAIAQSEPAPYYFITSDGDTTFCMSLDYGTNTEGYLTRVTFIKTSGEEFDIKGKRKVPEIVSFYMEGKKYDKIPYDLDSQTGEYIYSERKINGNIKVYLDHKEKGISPIYRFYVRLPDGSYLKVNNNANMAKYIKPTLQTCQDFNDAYQGDFSNDEQAFLTMVGFYNFLCD